jgi:choline dehydrogenase-like flavoprotein
VSFAQGGLAEAWTGGVYPFNDEELEDFPFSGSDIAPYYDVIAERIGISGIADDLDRFMPVHRHLMPPLDLDEHSRVLVDAYDRQRTRLNTRLGCYLGRSRIATLTRDLKDRQGCGYLGRCLWGCPRGALYTPVLTLDECRRFPGFEYRTGVYVRHFGVDDGGRVSDVAVEDVATGRMERLAVEQLVLAAGTLSTSRVFLESVYQSTGQIVTLGGLMDNRQIMMPFINLRMLRRPYNPDTYQYHQLGLGLEGNTPRDYVHGQITTLKTALIHPLVQQFPFDFKTSLAIFRDLHTALGLVNINFCDTRRASNSVTLEPGAGDRPSKLVIHYEPASQEQKTIAAALRRVRRVLWSLGCVVPPGTTRLRPMGASVHYAGLLPMSATRAPWTTSPEAQSHDFQNLYIVDGTTFPFLPAKNLTFTLMANAARVADTAF